MREDKPQRAMPPTAESRMERVAARIREGWSRDLDRLARLSLDQATGKCNHPVLDDDQQRAVERRVLLAPENPEVDVSDPPPRLRSPSSITAATTTQVSRAPCAEPSRSPISRPAAPTETVEPRMERTRIRSSRRRQGDDASRIGWRPKSDRTDGAVGQCRLGEAGGRA